MVEAEGKKFLDRQRPGDHDASRRRGRHRLPPHQREPILALISATARSPFVKGARCCFGNKQNPVGNVMVAAAGSIWPSGRCLFSTVSQSR
jgi:hypothetical protein